jgi:hypothetical protein
MSGFRITVDTKGLIPLFSAFNEKEIRRISANSMNRAANKARKNAAKALRTSYPINDKEFVKQHLKVIRRADGRKPIEEQNTAILFGNKRPNLTQFNSTDTGTGGVTTNAPLLGKPPLGSAFIASQKDKLGRQVFIRKSALGTKASKPRVYRLGPNGKMANPELPVQAIKAKSIALVSDEKGIIQRTGSEFGNSVRAEIEIELDKKL